MFRYRRNPRRGAAAVEAAVTLPILVIIAVGTIETSSVIFTKQALQSAAHECAREAAKPSATVTSVRAKLDQFSGRRNLTNVRLTMTPADPATLRPGDTLTVRVSLPYQEFGFVTGTFTQGDVGAECTAVKSF